MKNVILLVLLFGYGVGFGFGFGWSMYHEFGPGSGDRQVAYDVQQSLKYPIGSRWYIEPHNTNLRVVEGRLLAIKGGQFLFEDFRDCKSLYLIRHHNIYWRVDTTEPAAEPGPVPVPIDAGITVNNTLAGKEG